jgi:hypothetical protein
VSDLVGAEFRFLPNQEEIVLGILEKRRWHRRYAQLRTNLLPCPRCGGPFQTVGSYQRPWDPRCWSCDLSLNPPPK